MNSTTGNNIPEVLNWMTLGRGAKNHFLSLESPVKTGNLQMILLFVSSKIDQPTQGTDNIESLLTFNRVSVKLAMIKIASSGGIADGDMNSASCFLGDGVEVSFAGSTPKGGSETAGDHVTCF